MSSSIVLNNSLIFSTSGDTEIKRDGEKDTYIGSACPNNPYFLYNQREGRDHDDPKRIFAEACQVWVKP